jgi:L-threonylcarbamoyladenylate synthase
MRTIDARTMPEELVASEAARVVRAGGTVIFPTDTVYGIGCDPKRLDAVARIFRLKRRPLTKPLALHFGTVAELLEYADGNALAVTAARCFLPGPLTLIVERPPSVHESVTAGLAAVGLRVPGHALCRTILASCGPLAATSANRSGAPAFSGGAGHDALPAADLLIDDGPTAFETESTVVDVTRAVARVIRVGVITVEQLERRLGPVETVAGARRSEDA